MFYKITKACFTPTASLPTCLLELKENEAPAKIIDGILLYCMMTNVCIDFFGFVEQIPENYNLFFETFKDEKNRELRRYHLVDKEIGQSILTMEAVPMKLVLDI